MNGVFRCNIVAVFDNVNCTIWKGTIIEKVHSAYTNFANLELTLEIYQAAIDVQIRINATDNTVIINEYLTQSQKL